MTCHRCGAYDALHDADCPNNPEWKDDMNEPCPCCGAPMRGSDHCWFCGCEEYERYCGARYSADCPESCWQYRHFDYCPHSDELQRELREMRAVLDARDIETAATIDRVFDRD
jgi:hypothetical protein